MQRTYLATTAIAAALAAAPASAAEFEVRVGGYFEAYLAYAASDVRGGGGADFDGIDAKQDNEIYFLPSITLDNGLTIGADVQLEGLTSGDQIDESFLYINGSFGRILLGSENSAGFLSQVAAPDVTFLNINSGSTSNFIPFTGSVAGALRGEDVLRGTLGSTFLENARNNDAQRITYFTPRFAGFQLGVSYARDRFQDDNAQIDLNGDPLHHIFDIGLNYVQSFGDFDVAASARWGIADNDSGVGGSSPQVLGFGLNLGYAGVTIGGSWAEQNDTFTSDGQAFDVGISYETGPWGVSFTYLHGRNVDDEHAGFGFHETLDQFLLGVSYELARGVQLNAFGIYADFDEQITDAALPGGDDVDGFVIGTGIKLSF